MEKPASLDKPYYRSLTVSMVVTMIIVSVTPLMIISAITRHYFQVSYRDKVISFLKLSVSKSRHNIDSFLTERIGALRVQGRSYTFDQLTTRAVLEERLAILQEEYGPSVVDLAVVNHDGVQIAYAGPYRINGAHYADAPWFRNAIQKDFSVSDVFHGMRGFPHFVIAVRKQHDGKPWILKATISFEALNALVESFRRGASGQAFILNREGLFQTAAPQGPAPDREIFLRYLNAAPSGNKVVMEEGRNGADARTLCLMTRLNNGDWVLGFTQNDEEAFSDLYSARMYAISTLFISLVVIVVAAIALSMRMVTHVAKADHEKELMNEQLVEAGKLASLGELAAGIAHEINNPVAIMVQEAGWIQDLLDDYEQEAKLDVDELRRCLTRIQTQGRRCKDITHKLLRFARSTDLPTKEAQLNDLINEVVGLSEQRAKYGDVQIVTDLQEDLPTVHVSPTEVQQVFLNLVNNSLDELARGGRINISSRMEGDYVVVEVSDNGPGIPETNIPRIFEPFFTTKPVGKGTGLGLSICYGIMKNMGGRIVVESEVGKGTLFRVLFPCPKQRTASPGAEGR